MGKKRYPVEKSIQYVRQLVRVVERNVGREPNVRKRIEIYWIDHYGVPRHDSYREMGV